MPERARYAVILKKRSRSALVTTETEESAMQALRTAISDIGFDPE